MQESQRLQTIFFFSLLLLILVINVFVLLPYFGALFLAGTLAVIFRPTYRRILNKLKNERVAALLTLLLVCIIILVPLTIFGRQIFFETRSLYLSLTEQQNGFGDVIGQITNPFSSIANSLGIDLNEYLQRGANFLFQHFAQIFSSLVGIIFNFFLVLFGLFFFLKDGHKLLKVIMEYSPLNEDVEKKLFDKIETAINSVIRGQLTIAIVQGILTSIGFAIFGIPNPVLWGSLAIFASLIPSIGTALIIVPGILYLYFTGHSLAALGLLIWGTTAVGLIDNFLGPILIHRHISIHPFLIFISVIGGIGAFGPLGFLVGPVLLVLLLSLLELRPHVVKTKDE